MRCATREKLCYRLESRQTDAPYLRSLPALKGRPQIAALVRLSDPSRRPHS